MRSNPIDGFERIATAESYDYERLDLNELSLSVPGYWRMHDLEFSWNVGLELLQIQLYFESHMPGGRSDDMCRLISLINECVMAGHFDYCDKHQSLRYRNTMSLRGGAPLNTAQAMDMIALALDAAERGYPACQYVVWAGKSPEDALTSALVDIAALR